MAPVRPFLIGMPGAGKSTVAKQLARRLGLNAVDADAMIEQHLGETIRSFFDREGESAFRDLEERVLNELTQQSPMVLATGGGAVLRPLNRQRLRERGTVIYLRSAPEQLYRRLRHDTKRPLLQGVDPLKKLQALYEERDPLYRECAHFVMDTHGAALPVLVNRILMQLDLMQPPGAG